MDDELLIERLRQDTALSSTYAKGLRLAEDGAVVKLESVDGAIGDTVSVSGRVEGSRGELYRTEVSLDLEASEVIDYGCTCIAAASYPGMCKHEVALALEYLARRDRGPVMDARRARIEVPVAPVSRRGVAPSSPQIARLMSEATTRRVNEASRARVRTRAEREPQQPVELQLTVLPASDSCREQRTWCIKLRICRGKAGYVVKNIASLLDACRTGAEVSYGRNLAFAHAPEAFGERSRALLGIMEHITSSQRALFQSRWRYQAVGRGTDVKELPVSDADLIDILTAWDGGELAFEPDDGPYGSKGALRRLTVAPGDPEVPARLVPASNGGYDLRIDSRAYCLYDGARLCLMDESRAWLCSPAYAARAGALLSDLLPFRTALHIAPDDLPAFCRTLLPGLRAATVLDAPGALDRLVPPEPVFTFRIGSEDGLVSCDARVAYGDWECGLYGEAANGAHIARTLDVREPSRDLAAEYQVMDVVEEYFPGGRDLPGFDESDDELLYDLLTAGVAELSELGTVLLSERLRTMTVRDAPSLSVTATVRSGLLDLEVGASGLSARDLAAYLESYRRRQKFVRLSSGDIMRMGEGAGALDGLAAGLGVDPAALAGGMHELPAYRVPFVDELLRRTGGVRLSRNDAFREIVRDFDTYADADYRVPASLDTVLRGYQRDGFRWLQMLEHLGFGGILADDMGLGKTLQIICHVLACKEEAGRAGGGPHADGGTGADGGPSDALAPAGPLAGATLVVCPASLVYNWMAELARFAPGLDAVAVLGAKAQRRGIIASAPEHDVLVTSYDLMRRDIGELEGVTFARAVLDEAQYIKNPATQAAKAAKRLRARVRFACTGTPIENRTQELWNIFDFLMPGVLGTREAFAKAYGNPAEGGEFSAASRLRALVAPFILRRLKGDVLRDLPEKTESVVFARMTGEQDKLYRANQDRLALQISHELPDEFKKKRLQVLAELMKLRQICCDPSLFYEGYTGGSAKLDTCMELLSNALDAGHKILLFSQFTSMLDIIAGRLRGEGVAYLKLTGSTSKEERARLVERFQAGAAPVFLISLKAGGVGLNLTAADVVIHFDPWWNLAAQNQATDRAHRIGQKNPVSVFKLICQDTIEEKILKMQESKRELVESVIGGSGTGAPALSREDVLALLSASTG